MHLTSIEIAYRFPYANSFSLHVTTRFERRYIYVYYLQLLESVMMIILADSDYY